MSAPETVEFPGIPGGLDRGDIVTAAPVNLTIHPYDNGPATVACLDITSDDDDNPWEAFAELTLEDLEALWRHGWRLHTQIIASMPTRPLPGAADNA